MKTGLRKRIAAVCIALAAALTGCGSHAVQENAQGGAQQEQETAQQSIFGREDEFGALLVSQGIALPVSVSKVYVDQAGYSCDREKRAVFSGRELGSEFRVVRKSDGEIVYTGTIEEGGVDEISGLYLSTGDFSAVTEPGTYYIETDVIGQSYPFAVSEDCYENLFVGLLKNAGDAKLTMDAQGVCSTSFGMHVIMHAMQCSGALFEEAYQHFGDGENDKQLVTQLLYFASWLMAQQGADGSLYGDYEATAAFCGAMVMSRDAFGKYEESVSKEYQEASDRAWSWLETQECDTDVRKCARFYAAAQLFRSGFGVEYKTIAEEFLSEWSGDYSGGRFVFYGVLSYLNTERNTDRDLCTQIMKDLVNSIEELCEEAKSDAYFETGKRGVEECLHMMLLLSFGNYITPSKEYTELIENTIQYVGGLNESGACCLDGNGVWQETAQTADRSLEWNGIMILGMSDLLSNLNDLENS